MQTRSTALLFQWVWSFFENYIRTITSIFLKVLSRCPFSHSTPVLAVWVRSLKGELSPQSQVSYALGSWVPNFPVCHSEELIFFFLHRATFYVTKAAKMLFPCLQMTSEVLGSLVLSLAGWTSIMIETTVLLGTFKTFQNFRNIFIPFSWPQNVIVAFYREPFGLHGLIFILKLLLLLFIPCFV